jgi:hypothetical protein
VESQRVLRKQMIVNGSFKFTTPKVAPPFYIFKTPRKSFSRGGYAI